MNNDLYNICELAKTAADMSIPLEAQPVPEAGSQGVQGMTNNATLSPTSVGASEYGNSFGQRLLGKAKEMAACARAKFAAEEGADQSFTQRAKARLKEMYNPPADAPESMKYEAKGNRASLGIGATGLGMIGAAKASDLAIAKGYQNLGKQLTNVAALGIPIGMALAGKASYDCYKAWKAKRKENAEKTASIEEAGIYPEEAAYAMDSAEALYNDCLEKMAYAEELYADAADYLNYCDQMEKQANEYVPIAGSALGSALGATAGAAIGGRFNAMRAGAGIGAAIGGAAGGPAASALENFVATSRQ